MRFIIYKNSAWATIVSIIGAILIVTGLSVAFSADVVAGIILTVIGAVLSFLASVINENTVFKKWIKELNKKGALDELPHREELAYELYKANPSKRTLKYITRVNPSAGAIIRKTLEDAKEARKNKK